MTFLHLFHSFSLLSPQLGSFISILYGNSTSQIFYCLLQWVKSICFQETRKRGVELLEIEGFDDVLMAGDFNNYDEGEDVFNQGKRFHLLKEFKVFFLSRFNLSFLEILIRDKFVIKIINVHSLICDGFQNFSNHLIQVFLQKKSTLSFDFCKIVPLIK